jgi:hypothetical protein
VVSIQQEEKSPWLQIDMIIANTLLSRWLGMHVLEYDFVGLSERNKINHFTDTQWLSCFCVQGKYRTESVEEDPL